MTMLVSRVALTLVKALTVAFNAFTASLAASGGSGLVGFILAGGAAIARTVLDKLREIPVSVADFGGGTELGTLLQAAVNAGHTSIYVPTRTNWTWTQKLVLPSLWRGRIFGDFGYGVNSARILAATGHTQPMIDAQGTLFVEIEGLHVVADDSGGAAPACFVVMARMPSGASSGNHRVSRCVVEGQFYFCCLYNVGGEELVFENNYWSMYGTDNTGSRINEKVAPIVHQLSEDAFYTSMVTKAARTNGTSTSAIQHNGDVVKNENATGGASAIYVGPNCNDIVFNLAYGYTPPASFFLTLGGYFDGIDLNVARVETDKSSRIVWVPNDADAGSVTISGGAYRRSGAVDATKYAIDIAGSQPRRAHVKVDSSVCWLSSFGGGVEDLYLLRSTRRTSIDADFNGGGPADSMSNTRVTIGQLASARLRMGFSVNLTVTTYEAGASQELTFFADPVSSKQAFVLRGGLQVRGRSGSFFGSSAGAYHPLDCNTDTTANAAQLYFLNPNGIVGSVTTNGTATTYNVSSDHRLKENIEPVDRAAALAAVMAWPIYAFDWKADGRHDIGTIAHELQAVKPSAVSGERDAMIDLNGETMILPQGVDYSKLVPEVVAAIQHLAGEIETLKAARLQ